MCIWKIERESWALQAMLCDTRKSQQSTDEIFIAPLGYLSAPVESAIAYLKTVTLMNEIEGNDWGVREMIEAIGRINERYTRRVIKSQSVRTVKSWSPANPKARGYEAETTKKIVCVNSKLSLPHGGQWVDVCYLPEGAFSPDPEVREATFLNEMEIYTLLAEIGGYDWYPCN